MRYVIAFGVTLVVVSCGGSSVQKEAGDDDDQGGGGSSRGGSGTSRGGSGTSRGGTGATAANGAGGAVVVGGATGMGGASVTGGFGAGGGRGGGFSDAGPMDPPGPVMCGGEVCEPPLSCCIGNSRCFDPESEPEACPVPDPDPNFPDWRPCASSAHCAEGEYCQGLNAWMCQGPGICQSRTNCGGSSYAVCACDGNSYQDIGAACRAGTYATLFYGGACGDTVNANGEGYDPRWVTLCGNDEHCASGERCCPLTMICYPESDPGRCQVPPDGTHYPCTADDQCYPGAEICFGEGCEGPGGCGPLENEECGVRFEPVCGCDGVTYTSADCAMSEGTRVASEGECE